MEYTLKINDFEGPLDLLLHLIKESKMNIFDLRVDEITQSYLDYIKAMQEMNLDVASSYLVMASELIELKSKLLLPRHEKEDEEDEEDPRENLINRLIEYQKYKDLTSDFKELEKNRKDIFTKVPESILEYKEEISINSDVTLDDLVDAFQKFLERQKDDIPLSTKITKREISIEERKYQIKKILKTKKKANFFELFDVLTKEYVVVTFLAILEMVRKHEMNIIQENNFDEIICEVTNE